MLADVCEHTENVVEVPPGVDIDEWAPAPRDDAVAALIDEARRDPPNPGNADERLADEGNAARFEHLRAPGPPVVVYFGKLIEQKGVHLLVDAVTGIDVRLVVVGFGPERAALERRAAEQGVDALFTGPLEHRHLRHLLALADACVVPSIFPEAFGMVAAEAASAGCPPLVARHSGLAEVAAGLEAAYPEALRAPRRFRPGRRGRSRPPALGDFSLSPSLDRAAIRAAARAAVVDHWSWAGVSRRLLEPFATVDPRTPLAIESAVSTTLFRAVGDEQRVPSDQLLREARERFDAATDFTVAVEEEFALLDPDSLDLVNRFEDVQAAAAGTPAEGHLAGELIASEAEIKTGKLESFSGGSGDDRRPTCELAGLVDPLGLELGATGSHPWASWKDQRIIDTPHYRRNDELLRYVVWKNNTFGFHVHVGIRGADRAIRVTSALRNWLPELLALSASSPFAENVNTGLHSARTQIFTRFFPRCGVPDAFETWDAYERYVRFLYDTGSITEHTQLWWSVRPHLAFPTVEIRICDGQPCLAESQSLAALCVALTARIARALDEGEPIEEQPHRLIEENMWRAIRYGLSGELIDLERGEVLPARARIERLIEWVLPVASEIGAADWLRVPEQNAAERQIARFEEGDDLARIYGDLTLSPTRVGVGACAACRAARAVRQAASELVRHNLARRSRFGAFFVTCLRRVDGLLQ